MTMTSLIEDCQAWIEKGHESWNSYFSKWETFAVYEENLSESELNHEISVKPKKRRNENQKKHPVSRLKRVLFKNQEKRKRKLIRNKKICPKVKVEVKSQMQHGSIGDENLLEIIENEQLEITLRTVFSSFLKSNANKYEMFSVLFQTFTGGEMTVQNSDYLFPKKQLLFHSNFETNVTENLSFKNQQVLPLSVSKVNISDRSICPPRNVYLQSLDNNINENHSKLIQRNWGQWENGVGAENTNNLSKYNPSTQRCVISNNSQTPQLGQNLEVKKLAKLRFKNMGLKFIQFDSSPKFSRSFCHNEEYIKNASIFQLNTSQESRFGNLCFQKRFAQNRLSLSLDAINFKTSHRKLTEIKGTHKMPFWRRHPSEKLISDYKKSDSDSDDCTIFHSPLINHMNKRLRAEEPNVNALESDADDCHHIFDSVQTLI